MWFTFIFSFCFFNWNFNFFRYTQIADCSQAIAKPIRLYFLSLIIKYHTKIKFQNVSLPLFPSKLRIQLTLELTKCNPFWKLGWGSKKIIISGSSRIPLSTAHLPVLQSKEMADYHDFFNKQKKSRYFEIRNTWYSQK